MSEKPDWWEEWGRIIDTKTPLAKMEAKAQSSWERLGFWGQLWYTIRGKRTPEQRALAFRRAYEHDKQLRGEQ